ncbi:MAG: TolC family protein [Deltaproteobacteria bacterium]|jgi:adhesin transport system outer membrane protein|nr:TolC family protein [Deltaproteobacteria bacterium]
MLLCGCVAAGLSVSAAFGTVQAAEKNGAQRAALPPASEGTLEDTVYSTINYNPRIKGFQEFRQAAIHEVAKARSGWLPRADVRAGIGTEQWDDRSTRNYTRGRYPQNNYEFYERREASVVVSQTLWDGFATKARHDIATARMSSAESRLLDNTTALSLDAILAHIDVCRNIQLVKLSEDNAANHKRILASQTDRQRLGASSLADVTQTQSRLARSLSTLEEARANLETSAAAYRRLTGKAPRVLITPELPGNGYSSLESVVASSQALNPKITALRWDIESAKATTELSKSNFHPRITAEYSYGYNYQTGSDTNYNQGHAFMLRLQWNIFNGFYDWYDTKSSLATARQRRNEMEETRIMLIEETEKTWASYKSEKERAKHFAVAVEQGTLTRDMYIEQFNLGQRTLLDVLDSENEVFTSSQQHINCSMNEIANMYRLLALGGELTFGFGVKNTDLHVETDTSFWIWKKPVL